MERALLFLLPIGIVFVTAIALMEGNYLRLAIAAVMIFAFIDVKKRLNQTDAKEEQE